MEEINRIGYIKIEDRSKQKQSTKTNHHKEVELAHWAETVCNVHKR